MIDGEARVRRRDRPHRRRRRPLRLLRATRPAGGSAGTTSPRRLRGPGGGRRRRPLRAALAGAHRRASSSAGRAARSRRASTRSRSCARSPRTCTTACPAGDFSILESYVRALRSARAADLPREPVPVGAGDRRDPRATSSRNPPHPDFRLVIVLPGQAEQRHGRHSRPARRARSTPTPATRPPARGDRSARSPTGATIRSTCTPRSAIVDDRWLTVGSANLNAHSLLNDTEINVVTDDPELARDTRVRLWAEHLELDAGTVAGADPCALVDEHWRPIADGAARAAQAPASRRPTGCSRCPGVSRRVAPAARAAAGPHRRRLTPTISACSRSARRRSRRRRRETPIAAGASLPSCRRRRCTAGRSTFLRFARAHRMLRRGYLPLIVRWLWLKLRWRGRLQTDGLCFVCPGVKFEIGRERDGCASAAGRGSATAARSACTRARSRSAPSRCSARSARSRPIQHISIGRECIIADRVMMIDFDHGVVEVERPIREQGIYKRDVDIGHNVWIGYGACILRGVTSATTRSSGRAPWSPATCPTTPSSAGSPPGVIRKREAPKTFRWASRGRARPPQPGRDGRGSRPLRAPSRSDPAPGSGARARQARVRRERPLQRSAWPAAALPRVRRRPARASIRNAQSLDCSASSSRSARSSRRAPRRRAPAARPCAPATPARRPPVRSRSQVTALAPARHRQLRGRRRRVGALERVVERCQREPLARPPPRSRPPASSRPRTTSGRAARCRARTRTRRRPPTRRSTRATKSRASCASALQRAVVRRRAARRCSRRDGDAR